MSRVPAIGRSLTAGVGALGPRRRGPQPGLEPLDRLGLQPAIGEFLDAVGEPAFEEAAVVGRRLGLEEIAPLAFSSGVGVVFSAATRASTDRSFCVPHRVLADP